jgi:hypothetical protein
MRVRRGKLCVSLVVAAITAALGLAMGPAAAPAETVNIPWSELLPPLPTSTDAQPHAVPHCKRGRPRCVTTTVRRLRRLRDRLGCDHRAVFATTYLELTKQLRRDMRSGLVKANVASPRYFYFEDGLFANFYFRVIKAWNRGKPVPEAWRIAFEAAADGDKMGVQDMLLGINAHVQNDMPFVLAALGLRTPGGVSRKPDHDFFNSSLNRGYEPVVAAVRTRYDAAIDLSNSELLPIDDLAGLELTRTWREVVWRNAERLTNAKTAAERTQVARSIEQYAAANAQFIASFTFPGYGATRDTYCAAGPSGG